ncbi:DHA2 family efflux MFS transporter permease subunit [Aureliella helgolandensis]|nr:DHA2 family efflux MFS transporter permease subunit [Aureliella helgolandensis]
MRTAAESAPWIVAAAVIIPTFMEVLDTTIANVALRYIAGGLSSPVTDGEWVITSYLAANAFVLPISGWLAMRLGRRKYFLLSIFFFTLASVLCGMATSLEQLVLFRIMQGLAGGGLQPVSQSILLDAFPRERQGVAMTAFGAAALLAPVIGPTLGGYITDTIGWRWIFFLNLPVGLLALGLCHLVVRDPAYLVAGRSKLLASSHIDKAGFSFLCMAIVSWEILLSKGQEWDWIGDPFYRVHTLLLVFLASLGVLVVHELTTRNPLVDFRSLLDRNFRSSAVIIFCAYGVLYANTTTLPRLLQSLFGYDATTSGLILSPSGIFSIVVLFAVGAIMSRGIDARRLIGGGLVLMAVGNYVMAQMNLDISPWYAIWPRIVVVCGLSMIFAPLNVAAFQGFDPARRGAAVGLLALLRNEGGSVGTSLAKTLYDRRDQFHTARLNDGLDPLNTVLVEWLHRSQGMFFQITGDPAASNYLSFELLQRLRAQQAASLSYFDTFWGLAVVSLLVVPLVLLMRPSISERGAHIATD